LAKQRDSARKHVLVSQNPLVRISSNSELDRLNPNVDGTKPTRHSEHITSKNNQGYFWIYCRELYREYESKLASWLVHSAPDYVVRV